MSHAADESLHGALQRDVSFECIGTFQTVAVTFDRCYDVDGFGRKFRETAADYGAEANADAQGINPPGHKSKVSGRTGAVFTVDWQYHVDGVMWTVPRVS